MFISFVCLLLFFFKYKWEAFDWRNGQILQFYKDLIFLQSKFYKFLWFPMQIHPNPCNVLNSLFMSIDWPTNYTETPHRTLHYPSIPFYIFCRCRCHLPLHWTFWFRDAYAYSHSAHCISDNLCEKRLNVCLVLFSSGLLPLTISLYADVDYIYLYIYCSPAFFETTKITTTTKNSDNLRKLQFLLSSFCCCFIVSIFLEFLCI